MKRSNQAGLSLIEVMVSMMLLSVSLMGLAVAFPTSRVAVQSGSHISAAVNLARQTLEAMRNRDYTSTTDEIISGNFPNQGYNTIANFPNLRRVIQIQDGVPQAACSPPPGSPCTKTVTVTVFYRDERGTERAIAVSTIFVR